MLNIIKSNRIEYLMEGLASVTASPFKTQDDFFSPEWICVQSRGMKRWISIKLAEKFGICANCFYVFPGDIIKKIILFHETGLENIDSPLLSKDIMLWKIMINLPQLINRPEFKVLKNYIGNDESGIRLYQISEKIAGVFDDYLTYRPEMIIQWEDAEDNTDRDIKNNIYGIKDPLDMWQPVLWNRIVKRAGREKYPHIARSAISFLQQDLSNNTSDKIFRNPERISFFGISSIPPLFLKIFEKASDYIDINFFLLIPSKEFFGYIRSAKQMGKINAGDKGIKKGANKGIQIDSENDISQKLYFEQGNPVLASMGTSIKNFSLMLDDLLCNEPFPDLWYDPMRHSDSMLACIQSDILNLVHRKKTNIYRKNTRIHRKEKMMCRKEINAEINPAETSEICNGGMECVSVNPLNPIKISESDRSISIHSCHGPMREAQVLKDLILDLFLKDKDLKPHDIIVMMPDIESYAPYIDSIFSVEHSIPFTISDRRKRKQSEIIETFLAVLSLAGSRLMLTEVMDILSKKSIAQKFNFSEEDIINIKEQAEKAGICWGLDSRHRKHMGLPEINENTWWFGLQRLMLGYCMPENCEFLFRDVLPCDSYEGSDAEILGKFAFFCDTLFKSLEKLAKEQTIPIWCDTFRDILFQMMDTDYDNNNDREFILGCFDELRMYSKLAGHNDAIGFDLAFSALTAKLDVSVSSGSFLTGAMVFCNLMPMRSLPFKVVALMGMNDKDFPGQNIAASFDLIKKYPRLGDRIQRDEARYLFLESVLSARQNLIITYTGMSVKDNSIIPPAGVVSELIETICETFISADDAEAYSDLSIDSDKISKMVKKSINFDPDNFVIKHPLQPFSEKYFKTDNKTDIFSFSKHYFDISVNLKNRAFTDNNVFKKNDKAFKSKNIAGSKNTIEENYNIFKNSNAVEISNVFEFFDKNNFSTAISTALTIQDMISFFRMPTEYFVKKRLGIVFPKIPDYSDDREPVEMDGLENYLLGQLVLEKKIHHRKYPDLDKINIQYKDQYEQNQQGQGHYQDHNGQEMENQEQIDLFPVFKASGILPHGKKGKMEFHEIEKETESICNLVSDDILTAKAELMPFSYEIPINSFTNKSSIVYESLRSSDVVGEPPDRTHGRYIDIEAGKIKITGNINNVVDMLNEEKNTICQIRYDYSFAKFSPKRILQAWIYHLALNIRADGKYPVESRLILRSNKPGKAEEMHFLPVKEPFLLFRDLVELFENGMQKPLIFFPETSWAFAETIFKSSNELSDQNIKKALSACRKKWGGSFNLSGEKTNRYLSFIFNDKEPFFYQYGHNDGIFNIDKGAESEEGVKNADGAKDAEVDESIDSHDSLNGISSLNYEFVDNAIKIFSPLMENMEIINASA